MKTTQLKKHMAATILSVCLSVTCLGITVPAEAAGPRGPQGGPPRMERPMPRPPIRHAPPAPVHRPVPPPHHPAPAPVYHPMPVPPPPVRHAPPAPHAHDGNAILLGAILGAIVTASVN